MSDAIPFDQATSALISKLQNWSPDVYNALNSLQKDLAALRASLAVSPEALVNTDVPNVIESLVWPKTSNPPPLSQPKEGKCYYNTSRARHGFSTDSWPYYDVSTPENRRIYYAADFSVLSAAETNIPFNSLASSHMMPADTNGIFNIPLDGRYFVGGHVRWATGAGNTRALYLKKNTTVYIAIASQSPVAGGGPTDQGINTIYDFAVGDTVQMNAYQDSGGALNILTGDEFSAVFYIHRLG